MAFYQGYGITPRIYTSFTGGELDKLQPVLEFYGFKITTHNDIFMLFQDGTISAPASRTKIRRIRGISQNILDLAYSGNDENWGDWSVKVLQKSIKNPDFHLLGLFDGGKCMSIASLYIMDGYSRVDDVKTHAGFRGRHFGTQLMTCLAAYHRRISGNYLYLRADNPIAIRMYRNIGFQDINIDARDWAAFIPPAETISSG